MTQLVPMLVAFLAAALLGVPAAVQPPGVSAMLQTSPGPYGLIHLDLWETSNGAVLTNYDVDMTKQLHLIVISADFRTFMHTHPQLGRDGHFRLDVYLSRRAHYYVYADAAPHGYGKRVFRFEVRVADAPARPYNAADRATGASATTAVAGPYTVTLEQTSFNAREPVRVRVHVRRDRKPASDLHAYLGAPSHAIIVNTGTLMYVHVHPQDADQSMAGGMQQMQQQRQLADTDQVSPDMSLDAGLLSAGVYKLWLEFRGGRQAYVAPFYIVIR